MVVEKHRNRKKGGIDYLNLSKLLVPKREALAMDDEEDADVALTTIRNELLTIAGMGKGMAVLEKLFRDVDKDGSGKLDSNEFRYCLAELGWSFEVDDVERLIALFDPNGDGLISHGELEILSLL